MEKTSVVNYRSVCLTTDVITVRFIDNYLICSNGGHIQIFDVVSSKILLEEEIFQGQRVHGIVPGPEQRLAVFGGRMVSCFKLVSATENCESASLQLCERLSWWLSDWVLALEWLEGSLGGVLMALVTSSNTVYLWESGSELKRVPCRERCILYPFDCEGKADT
uniref:Uncharacterized protein n=1 Tax=Timema douglasi TaxID=61478 RepID=A0A7R8VXF5_TIMDO|nr:unnamed protein product [Timema douglasi]